MRTVLASAFLMLMISFSTSAQQVKSGDTRGIERPQRSRLNALVDLVTKDEQDVFSRYNFEALTLSRGERVGDVFDKPHSILLASTDDCFPGLEIIKAPNKSLYIEISDQDAIDAAISIPGIASANGSTRQGMHVTSSFEDVQLTSASTVDFVRHLKQDTPECRSIAPYFGAIQAGTGQIASAQNKRRRVSSRHPTPQLTAVVPGYVTDIPLVVGAVLSGRQSIEVDFDHKIGAELKASISEQIARVFGFHVDPQVSIGGDTSSGSRIRVVSTDVIPIAIAPAFVETGSSQHASNSTRFAIAAIDPTALFGDIAAGPVRYADGAIMDRLGPPTITEAGARYQLNSKSGIIEEELRDADRALSTHRTDAAQEALERAETRLLDRAASRGTTPGQDAMVEAVSTARSALARGDTRGAHSAINVAIGGSMSTRGGSAGGPSVGGSSMSGSGNTARGTNTGGDAGAGVNGAGAGSTSGASEP